MSRTLEIFKTVAASETNINYTVLMLLRSKTITAAMPKVISPPKPYVSRKGVYLNVDLQVMLCSMIDPIHIHEMPRMVYNFIMNSISLPLFYAVSVFQREMEIPTIPVQSVVELFTNGSMCACCVSSGCCPSDPSKRCTYRDVCHTKRVKDMLLKLLEHRGFLPRESGAQMLYDTNCTPYITAYGNDMDRCDMAPHDLYGKVRSSASCMRGRPSSGKSMVGRQPSNKHFGSGGDGGDDGDDALPEAQPGTMRSESVISDEACKMFAKQCFQWYTKPFAECAMITEGEFCNSVEEFMRMSTKFAQFFGDLPFFGKHRTVMRNLGIQSVPREFEDLTTKQVFEQGQPIIRAR